MFVSVIFMDCLQPHLPLLFLPRNIKPLPLIWIEFVHTIEHLFESMLWRFDDDFEIDVRSVIFMQFPDDITQAFLFVLHWGIYDLYELVFVIFAMGPLLCCTIEEYALSMELAFVECADVHVSILEVSLTEVLHVLQVVVSSLFNSDIKLIGFLYDPHSECEPLRPRLSLPLLGRKTNQMFISIGNIFEVRLEIEISKIKIQSSGVSEMD